MAFKFSPFRKITEFFYGLYMESGFIDTISTAPCNPGTFTPSRLEYNLDVADYMSSIPFPLQGVISIEESVPYFAGQDLPERDSAVTGCSDSAKSDHITLCGELYEQAEPTYCVGSEIFRRKFIHQFIPPSNFSGKLQQYVQALYGSRRGDYSTEEGYPLQNYPLFVNGVQLGYGFTPHTSGLLCGPDYTYYLINIGSSVTARELEPSDIGTDIHTHLIAHDGSMTAEEIRKVESYLLSTCRVSTTSQAVSVDLSSAIGEPAAYGWQFNGDGTKADIILHRDNLPTDQNWHAYHYRLEFSVTAGVVSASLTEVSANAVWSGVHGSNVLRPDYLTGNMSVMINPQNDPFSGWATLSVYEAPVYCFYDDNDELQVFSVKSQNAAAQSINITYTGWGVQNGYVLRSRAFAAQAGRRVSILRNGSVDVESVNMARVTSDSINWFEYTGATLPGSLGFNKSAIEDIPNEHIEGTSLTVRGYARDQGWFVGVNFQTGALGPNGETIYCGASSRSNIGFQYHRLGQNTHSTATAMSSFIIPHRSCKSVISSVKNKFTPYSGSRLYNLTNYNVDGTLRTKAECHYFDYYTPTGGGPVIYQNVRGPFNISNRIHQSSSTSTTSSPNNATKNEVFFNLSTAKNNKQLIDEVGLINQFQYDKYFDFAYLIDPYGYFNANAKSSLMSADYVQLDGSTGVFNDDFINDVAVGWA